MTKAVKALVIIGAVFAPWLAAFLTTAPMLSLRAHAAQGDFLKLTVGYTPIAGASLPFFIAVEEKSFQKYGLEVSPIFMGGSPLINSAILSGEFPIGYTGGGALMSSRLAGSDLIAIASPLPVLTIDGWARPEIKSVADLKGKRIGVTRFGASSYFAGLSMLESAGVKPSEVVFIQNGGVGESLAALLGGRVDVYFRLPSSRRESRGLKRPRAATSRSTFCARSTKGSSSPEKTRRRARRRSENIPASTMTRSCRAASNTTGPHSPAHSAPQINPWRTHSNLSIIPRPKGPM